MRNPLAGIKDKDSARKAGLFVLLAFAVLCDILFFLRPQVSGSFKAVQRAGTAASDLERVRDAVSKTGLYEKTITSYGEKIDRYEKMLPAEKEIPALLEDLSAMARDSNIKILGITPVVAAPEKNNRPRAAGIYQEIPILINAKSGYHELGDFINNLENARRFMKVIDIGIRANKGTPEKHDVELIVMTYILPKGR